MKNCTRVLAGLLLLLCAMVSAGAQSSSGGATLSGVVVGPDGKPVANASVVYQSSGGRAPHAVHTDAKGHFTVTGLKQDNYDVRASANGMMSDWERNVMVRKGTGKQLRLKLAAAPSPHEAAAPPAARPQQ